MAPAGLLESFVAAVQASLSVLLVIFYGGVAARLGLLTPASTKAISKVCVRIFLPALLFVKIGSELHAGSAHRYVIVLVWAIVCHAVSFVLGIAGQLLLGMPDWTTVAVMFNNTTSYPLLLISALDQTGILQALVEGQDETTRQAIERAKSYFLVFSTVSSCLTFAVGPRLIDWEHAPEPDGDEVYGDDEGKRLLDGVNGNGNGKKADDDNADDVADNDDDDEDGGDDNDDNRSAGHLFDETVSFRPAAADATDAAGPSDEHDVGPRPASRSSGYDPLSDAPPLASASALYSHSAPPVSETTGLLSPYSTHGAAKPATFRASVVQFIDPFASAASTNTFFPSIRHKASKAKQPSSTFSAFGAFGTSSVSHASHASRPSSHLGVLGSRSVSVDMNRRRMSMVPRASWRRLGPRTRWWLLFIADFFNAPLLGAIVGALVGLTPVLHRAFFNPATDGGVFTPWLTASLEDIGGLFVPLPVVIAGVSLYTAMREVGRRASRASNTNDDDAAAASSSSASSASSASGRLPVGAVLYILVLRFVVWSLAGIVVIYVLAAHTNLVGDDPMLWFTLMLMPTGPPAMKLITLVQISDADSNDETSISKLLTISYLISPLLSFTVVGSLRASLANMPS